MNKTITAVSWIALSVLLPSGQTKPEAPEFEVASVKPAAPSDPRMAHALPMLDSLTAGQEIGGGPTSREPGRVTYKSATLKTLLAQAYHLKPRQISGPEWLDTERYEVIAKAAPGTDTDHLRLMLQRLLTERFHIQLHRESKEQSVYLLKVAKGGPKLKPAEPEPEYKDAAERTAAMRTRMTAMMAAMQAGARAGETGPRQSIQNSSSTLGQLADTLSTHLDRPVIDVTELQGAFAFSLSWAPDRPLMISPSSGSADTAAAPPSGPSIFTAIQEQLGLKLESAKAPVEMLVVDRADKVPVEN